jgi:succinate dehydrogenase / fumarate reductase, cytochrome b subunit
MEAMTFWRTTVGKKMVMAVTGVVMILFLVAHVAGNLLVFRGPVQLDAYSAFLKHEAVGLWTVRLVLLAAVVLHVIAAYQLARNDRTARLKPYVQIQPRAATLASRTMRVGGIIIAAFVIFHLLHLTTGTIQPAPFDAAHVHANVVGGFRVWWVSAIYLVALVAIGLHLYHGAWSWARTLGLSRSSPAPLHRPVAIVVAVLIWAAFTSIPLAILVGLVR